MERKKRVVQLIKRYLKSGVMENGVVIETEEGSPQGGNLSPLLANIYLNEFDWEFVKRGVPCIRYADDIVLLAKSKRASERLLESSTRLDTEILGDWAFLKTWHGNRQTADVAISLQYIQLP